MFKIKQFVFNPFEESTFLLIDQDTREAAVIDAGMFSEQDNKEFDNFVTQNQIKVVQIINTHMHVDHCFGANYVKDKYGVKLAANDGDAAYAASMEQQASRFGIRRPFRNVEIDIHLQNGDVIEVGKSKLKVIAVPGHSQGGIALYCEEQGFLIAGDSLFRGAIGRTDFEGGNHEQLVKMINERLMTLPDDTIVIPGHGPFTTIGQERKSNPYL